MNLANHLKPIKAVLLGAFCLTLCTGCVNLTGHWMGNDLKPEMARDQFRFLQPGDQTGKFVSTDLRLQKDGSYTAETNYDGVMQHSMGHWKYDNKGFLNLTDSFGNSYGYGARKLDERTLQVIKGVKGSDVTLTLKKQ